MGINSKKEQLICACCAISFSAYKKDGKSQKYCSRQCSAKGMKNRPVPPSKKIEVCCKHCNSVVRRYKNKNRPQDYCSRKCYLASDGHKAIQSNLMKNRGLVGEKNPTWKGENISYKGIHGWISNQYGAAKTHTCEFCKGASGSKKMNWANMDRQYTRDRESWKPLCKICHSNYDQENFKLYSTPRSEQAKKNISEAKIRAAKTNNLPAEQIMAIFLSKKSSRKLGKEYGLSPKAILQIKHGERGSGISQTKLLTLNGNHE